MINKDFLALIAVTVLTVIALVYGFTTIPNPAKQRAIKLDHKRVVDLGELHNSITSSYSETTVLPQKLDGLKKKYSYSDSLNTTDPDTGEPYEYIVTDATNYQLCATFATDSSTESEDTYDTENYNYSTYKQTFPHPVGRKCFTFTVTPPYMYQYDNQTQPNQSVNIYNYSPESSNSGQYTY